MIAGPHLENFREIEAHFEVHRAMMRIRTGHELADAVRQAAEDPALGQHGKEAAAMKCGAAKMAADAVMDLYTNRYPVERLAQPAWMFLWFFSQLWRAGSAYDRRRK